MPIYKNVENLVGCIVYKDRICYVIDKYRVVVNRFAVSVRRIFLKKTNICVTHRVQNVQAHLSHSYDFANECISLQYHQVVFLRQNTVYFHHETDNFIKVQRACFSAQISERERKKKYEIYKQLLKCYPFNAVYLILLHRGETCYLSQKRARVNSITSFHVPSKLKITKGKKTHRI